MTHGGWKAPSTHSKGTDLAITSELENSLSDKSSDKLPPVFAGLDKAEALAYVSRLFDAAAAGAVLWGDKLVKRAWAQIKDDIDETGIDRQELLSWAIQTLITASGQAMKQKNPGAVVACIRQLDHMTGTGYNSHRGYGFHRRLH